MEGGSTESGVAPLSPAEEMGHRTYLPQSKMVQTDRVKTREHGKEPE